MKTTDIKVFVCCPSRNFVTVKVIAADGIYLQPSLGQLLFAAFC